MSLSIQLLLLAGCTPQVGLDKAPSLSSDTSGLANDSGDTDADSDSDTDSDSDSDSDTDTGSDSDLPDASGLVGGYLEYSLMQVVCPDCIGMSDDLSITAGATFHEPTAGSWLAWLPPTGGCVLNPTPDTPATPSRDAGDWVYLTSDGASVPLAASRDSDGQITYLASGLSPSSFPRNTWFNASNSGGTLPSFEVDEALETPPGFDSISPIALLDTSTSFSGIFSRSGTTISWSPANPSGAIVLMLGVYNPAGDTYLGEVYCRAEDNGSLSTGSVLADFPVGSLMVVYLFRQQTFSSTLPLDHSTLEAMTSIGVIGTASLTR